MNIIKKCLVSLLILISACKNYDTGNDKAIITSEYQTISITKEDSLIELNSIVDNVDIIPLETTKECLISRIKEVINVNNNFLICSEGIHDNIYMFDSEGNFIKEIGSFGKGPGEFLEVSQIGLDKYKKRLFVYDLKSRRINYYSFDGQFIESKKINIFFKKMQYLSESSIALFTCSGFNPEIENIQNRQLIIVDNKFNPLWHQFPLKRDCSKFHYVTKSSLTSQNSQTFFNPMYSDLLYILTQDSIKHKYTIDLKVNPIPSPIVTHETDDSSFKILMENHNFFSGVFYVLDKFIYLQFNLKNNKLGYVFYDRYSEKSNLLRLNIYNWKDLFFSSPLYSDKNRLIVAVSATAIAVNKEHCKTQTNMPDSVVEIIESVNESDNPVIFIYNITYK